MGPGIEAGVALLVSAAALDPGILYGPVSQAALRGAEDRGIKVPSAPVKRRRAAAFRPGVRTIPIGSAFLSMYSPAFSSGNTMDKSPGNC